MKTLEDYTDYNGPHMNLLRKARRMNDKIASLEEQTNKPLYRNNPDIWLERMEYRKTDAYDAFTAFLDAIGENR